MKTNTFKNIIQTRVAMKLKDVNIERNNCFAYRDLQFNVARLVNGFFLERNCNHKVWCRPHRNRLFIYNTATRRAVIELGLDTMTIGTDDSGMRLCRGFELHLMGGIYNEPLPTDLSEMLI